jgi:rhodanese-related sulfurtransferase
MFLSMTALLALVLLTVVLGRRWWDSREMEQRSITPEALRELMLSKQTVLVVDVRQPLDLLGESVIIPGAKWYSPEEVHAKPSLLPKQRDLVVYCTCPSDKTSRVVLRRALSQGFSRIKFLKGGLDGWKSKGYPVEPYTQPFHLDRMNGNQPKAII